ncbi:MAG: N-acetylmuramoyl-L-alanine amidase family protein [Verrucomicrobiales bacterium]|nr:N-acetylmuramoyl-L-alanine amidase family protein [Verrucomicrobiales bacterium]
MFDSKKWLILFFVLALLGSIGGSLVAFLIMDKKQKANVKTPPAAVVHVEPVVQPVAPPPTPVVAKVEEAKVETVIDENIKPDFEIVSREEWKAKPPVSAMKPHTPSVITIHHTATTPTPDKSISGKLRGLQEFSQHEGQLSSGKTKPAWADLPYHFYIDVHGKVAEGIELNYAADVIDYDATGHVRIVVEGNFEKVEPTKEQMDALFKLVSWLSNKFKIPTDKISSHRAFMSTTSPGKNLESRLDEIRQYAWKK